jgi:hypothetical protein
MYKVASLLIGLTVLTASSTADVKVKTRMTTAGHGTESTQYVKGARQRTEMEMGPGFRTVNIYQCDLERLIVINERMNRCMVVDLKEDASDAASTAEPVDNKAASRGQRSGRTGGIVTITTGAVDTGERKDFFGYKARRIKTNMSMESSGNVCSDGAMAMDSDGWYIDFPQQNIACTSSSKAAMSMRPTKGECRDQIKFKRTGNARLGFPVTVESNIKSGGQSFTSKVEALDLSNATLDAKLFDMPAGCKVVSSYADLMGMGNMADIMRQAESSGATGNVPTDQRPSRSTRAGKLRVGLVNFGNSSGQSVQVQAMRMKLASEINQFEFEAVELSVPANGKLDDAEKAAQEAGCQYFVFTDVSRLKVPAGGKKLGGFLARATGVDSSASMGTFESEVQYRVYEVNEPEEPRLQPELQQSSMSTEGTSADDSVSRAVELEAGEVVVQIRKDLEWKRRGIK